MLTGAQVAAVVFSPGGKAFSLGHLSVDAVVNRFMAGDGAEVQAAVDDNQLQELHRQDGEMRVELAERKKRKKRTDEALAQECTAGDQIAAWLDPDVRDMGYEDMAAFAAALLQVQAAVSGRANQVLVEVFHVDISRKLQVPPPPLQLFAASTFEFGSCSSANENLMQDMQEMQLAMLPPQGFSAGMEMQMLMPSPQGFAGGMDMDPDHMLMAMQPQPGFAAGTDIQQMLPPLPEFPARMEMAQQGFPY